MQMKRGAARAAMFLGLATLTALLSTGDACDNVPSMDIDEACLKACSSQQLYKLCRETLRHADPRAEVTTYALVAAKLAKLKYEPAMEAVDRLLQSSSLSGREWMVYSQCKDKYAQAGSLMASVVNRLFACSLADARQEFINATVAVTACGNGLSRFKSSPLYAMNLDDQDRTMLAYELWGLVVGK